MKTGFSWKRLLAVPLCATFLVAAVPDGHAAQSELSPERMVVQNLPGALDYVTVAGIKKGDVLYMYDHPSMYTPIEVKTATSSTLQFSTKKLKDERQTLYFILKRNGQQVGNYEAITTEAPAMQQLGESGMHLVNRSGYTDSIKIHDAYKGYTYRVYETQDRSRMITSVRASKDGYLSINCALPKYENAFEQKAVYVTVQAPGAEESAVQSLLLTPEQSLPINAKTVTVKNNKTYTDTIHINPIKPESIVRVYRTKKETTYVTPDTEAFEPPVVAERKARAGQTTVYVPQLGTAAGSVYLTIQEPGELESDPVLVKYAKEKK